MITEPQTAKRISELMTDIVNRLAESCSTVKERCPFDEYAAYLKAISPLASAIVFDVLGPLYAKKKANLKPETGETRR